ncbi:MAG: hypothetical protein WCT47_07540 [Betaproteobacteria bacterium]|jgi:hypothetical protein
MSFLGKYRGLLVSGVAAVLLMFNTSADAEAAKFRMITTKFLDLRSVIEPVRWQSLTLGGELKIVPKPNAAAQAHFRNGFQLRIYRVGGKDETPLALETFEPCLVFVGNRYPVGGSEVLQYGLKFDDPGWLTLLSGKAPESGRYLMVAEVMGDENPIVRIRSDKEKKALQKYFASGIYFEVKPPEKLPDKSRIEEALKSGRDFWDKVKKAAKINANDRDCISLVAQDASDGDHVFSDALACAGQIDPHEVNESASPMETSI